MPEAGKALRAPVRAVSRMLGNRGGAPTPAEAPVRDPVIGYGVYVDGVRQPDGDPAGYAEALELAGAHDNGFVWIGLREPAIGQLDEIAEVFKLPELAVEDAVKSAQRPKIEHYGDMVFVSLRTARYVEHEELTETSEVVETGDVMMFIGPHFVITVRHGDAVNLGPVRARLEERADLLGHGPWAVAWAVYDLVVDTMLDIASSFEEDISVVEEYVFDRHVHGRIQRIYHLKRELMEFKRAVLPLQRPVGLLSSGLNDEVPTELRQYFRDVSDHLTRATEQVMYFDDLLNSILQARLTQVTVDQNNDMRKIAAWASIAAVWTAVAGIYGMNFDYMPETDWKYGYPALIAVLSVITVLLYRALRRNGWL